MNIKRVELDIINNYENYIKECCEHVSEVFCSSIYFFIGSNNFFSWGGPVKLTREQQDFILAGINGMFKTEFVFKD